MPNRFMPLHAGTDTSALINMINKNFAELDNESVTKVFKGAGGINAFTLGQIKDIGIGMILRDSSDIPRIACYIDSSGTPILKVSKDGFDVTTTGDENLIFNSAQNVFKIAVSDTQTVTTAALTYANVVTIPHGLSYVPAALVFVENGSSYYPVPRSEPNQTTGAVDLMFDYYTDATYLNVIINVPASSPFYAPGGFTANFKYYLLQETAN